MALSCPATETSGPCKGTLTLTTAKKFKLNGKGAKKAIKLAGAKFTAAAGKTVKVPVKVSKAGLKLLRRSKPARKVIVKVAVSDKAGNHDSVSRRIKTNRPPK